MDWREYYSSRMVSPEEAVKVINSGDRVIFSSGRQPLALGLALAARKEEVRDVKILVGTPDRDFGWYDPGWEESFNVTIGFGMPLVTQMLAERRSDVSVNAFAPGERFPKLTPDEKDILMIELSEPDEHGFCSFGQSVWNKKEQIEHADVVLAEINKLLIRTAGDNWVHVSELDYFVEHTPSERREPGTADLRGATAAEPPREVKAIADNIASLIRDGDTLEIGVGLTTEPLGRLGVLDNKLDLGYHSEHTPRGIIKLIMEGVINGKRKTINTGKAVATALGGTREELTFAQMNPLIELRHVNYTNDVRTIAQHDNMVAINNALSVDLTGQISAESIGTRMFGGTGGQLAFAIGAALSRGGRTITALPSTAKGGAVSRIVPLLELGTVVTVPRSVTDCVVTEYGIARLRGKTQRQRTEEIIAIAHPDFRPELRAAANKLYYP